MKYNKLKEYPFNEGDDYWVVVTNTDKKELEIVWSCWDYISEQIHDEDPDRLLFATEQEATEYINQYNDEYYESNSNK